MALTSTMYRFVLDISDVERGVYTSAELRVAQHPSETNAYLITRVLAYCLSYDPDLQMGRGVADPDDPPLSVMAPGGGYTLWVDIGAPTAERIHKASKLAEQVVIYTHRDVDLVLQALRARKIHRAESLQILALPVPLLRTLEEHLDRRSTWAVVRNEGMLYVTIGEQTFEGPLTVLTLGDAG